MRNLFKLGLEMTAVLTQIEFRLEIQDNSESEVLAALQVLGRQLYEKRTNEMGRIRR